MQLISFPTELFGFDGRGPEIHRFIHDCDLIAPGTSTDKAQPPGNISGVEYYWHEHKDLAWVIFEGLQVIQIVPEEVCSYWFIPETGRLTNFHGITEILNSPWKASFSQRHLEGIRHFAFQFYDDIIEVLCRSLAFGSGAFRIEDHLELSFYKAWPPKKTEQGAAANP